MPHIKSLDNNSEEIAILRDLYPELNPDQLLEAKERLDGYFEVVISILKRSHPEDQLTRAIHLPNMTSKVDSHS
jgi:hypothetical protein